MKMKIREIIGAGTINLALEVASKEECIDKMAGFLFEQGYLEDAKLFVQDVIKREEMSSTGIGFSVAIPHGKSAWVKKPGLAFAKLNGSVDWNSLDEQPVSMVFLIAVPEEQAGTEHLKILTTLARKLIHESFRDQLMNAHTANDILLALDF
jgi:PTS system fructose-specific IIA component